jgi:hypothetical protein
MTSMPVTTVAARETTTIIDLLEWTYRVQMADRMSGQGVYAVEEGADGGISYGSSSAAAVARNAVLGATILSTGHMQRYALHPDAEAVHAAVQSLPWAQGLLLMQYARTGDRPRSSVSQSLEPVLCGGHPRLGVAEIVRVRYRNAVYRDVPVTYCQLELYPSDEYVALCMVEHNAWVVALEALRHRLGAVGLKRWRIAA